MDNAKVKNERGWSGKYETTLTFYIDKVATETTQKEQTHLFKQQWLKDGQDGAKRCGWSISRDSKEVLKQASKAWTAKMEISFVNTETGNVFVKKNNAWTSRQSKA